MVPHRYKPKLPNFLSFPVGFEAVADALKNVPVLDEMELRFSAYSVEGAKSFRKTIEAKKSHIIVSAAFIRWDKRPSIGDKWEAYLRGTWEIAIYPCARQSKMAAKTALLREGLPAIARWLSEKRPPGWYWGRKRCDVMFIPDEGTVEVREFEDAI